ncbi:MAG: class I SAM-dependent methyltransferase [Litoreibacter sp.]|nr:class I SAM-dependent methyltransferase [Litoreibacter sp.]
MSALKDIIAAQIAQDGPMSLSGYMALCLLHPEHGYYATRDPFGRAGDFTTAPEISQMFGELLGLALAQNWLDQGAPKGPVFCELGPGRGTLMRDTLRATARVPGFAPQVHLVEASPTLRGTQRETLTGHEVVWHDTIATLPEAPLFMVANEFFDALPIRQFVRAAQGWSERRVTLQDGALGFGLTEPAPVEALAQRLADTRDGNVVEICPGAGPVMAGASERIGRHGGATIVVDYGGWHSLGDTFQAMQDHAFVDPFADPGAADLTAHVDFEALAQAVVPPCVATGLTPQGVLLERLGITERAQRLASGLSGKSLESHIAAHRRLTHPEEMGSLFKAIAIHPETSPPPPGFD